MGNIFTALFNFGATTQAENIIISAKIDTLIKRIKKDFSKGEFSQAFDDLNSSLVENTDNITVTYELLLIKLKFFIDCRRFKEANELIEVLEKKYKKFNNNLKFKELKLTMMSLNDDDKFLEYAETLRIETPNSKPKGHFEIIYYLNTRNIKKAKEIFEEEIKIDRYKEKLYLVGGHIYSNKYRYLDSDAENFDKADTFYSLALEHIELDFLEKLQISGFYATHFMNNQLRDKVRSDDILKKALEEYKTQLNIIMNNRDYFEKDYIDNLIDNYLFSLISLNLSTEYIEFYESLDSDSSTRHYLTYCDFKNIEVPHSFCQEEIFKNNSLEDILVYISLIDDGIDEDKKIVLDFFNENKELVYKNEFVLYLYVKGLIYFKLEIDEKIFEEVSIKKDETLEYILAYFELLLYLNKPIINSDIEELYKKAQLEEQTVARLYQSVSMLQRVNAQKKYLNLIIEKQNIFTKLVFKALENICFNDKNLLLTDFNDFVEQINNPNDYSGLIGNIYAQHEDFEKAFKYFYIDFEKRKDIDIGNTILHLCWVYHQKFSKKISSLKQDRVYNFMIGKLDELEIDKLISIFAYSLIIEENTSNTFSTLNQYLLNENINDMDNDLKINFSNIHIQTMARPKDLYKKTILIENNLCLEKDGCTYIKDIYEINEENKNSYSFFSISEDDYNLKKQEDGYEEVSLFHRITGPFAFRCDNPSMVSIDIKEDASGLFEFMEEQQALRKEIFTKYNDGELVTLYNLAEKDYTKYFSLISKLLNDENHNFNNGKYNYQPKETKKILTLSSIILLDEIKYLDLVLEKEDIFIQRTLFRFLIAYKENLEQNSCEIPKFDSTNYQFGFHLETDYFKEKDRLVVLIDKILKYERVIEDDKENLPIKGASSILSSKLGMQEYHSLAYSYKNNYQIISEDKTYNKLFEILKFNSTMVSNATSVLEDVLSPKEFYDLKINLYYKKYKNLIDSNYLTSLKKFMFFNDIDNLNNSEKVFVKLIVGNDEVLDELKKFGEVFDLKYFLSNPPKKTLYDINLDKLLEN